MAAADRGTWTAGKADNTKNTMRQKGIPLLGGIPPVNDQFASGNKCGFI